MIINLKTNIMEELDKELASALVESQLTWLQLIDMIITDIEDEDVTNEDITDRLREVVTNTAIEIDRFDKACKSL
jgi:hypothetical protein